MTGLRDVELSKFTLSL